MQSSMHYTPQMLRSQEALHFGRDSYRKRCIFIMPKAAPAHAFIQNEKPERTNVLSGCESLNLKKD